MPDARYENPRIAELYDLGNPWSVDRDFYLSSPDRRADEFWTSAAARGCSATHLPR